MKTQYVTVFASDMAVSTAFFRDVLGLPLRFESPGWTELDAGSVTIALHPTSAPGLAEDAPRDSPGSARIGFNVPDIDAFHERMGEHGVVCVQEPTLMHGAKLAQYVGPDGMVFSIGESR